MIILSDMDGVVADFVSVVLEKYNQDYADQLTHSDIKDSQMELFAKCGTDIYKYFHDEGLFRDCPVIDGAQEALNRFLDDGHEVYFVTKPVDHSLFCFKEKQAWVDQHFPRIGHKNVIFTGQKHLIHGEVLIDDMVNNLLKFEGMVILKDQPWNQDTPFCGLTRASTWEEIYHLVSFHSASGCCKYFS